MDQVIHYARNPEKTTEASRKKLHEIEGIVDYAADELKTERCTYVTGINLDSVETAAAEFMEVKQIEGKLGIHSLRHPLRGQRYCHGCAVADRQCGRRTLLELVRLREQSGMVPLLCELVR